MSAPTVSIPSSGMVNVSLQLIAEGDRIIARWPQLKLSAHGASRQEAIQKLAQMIYAVWLVSLQRGDLEKMLQQAGVKVFPMVPGQLTPALDNPNALPHLVMQPDADAPA